MNAKSKKKAIVIGASSGIGRALAKVLAQAGYEVGLTARRLELLEKLQKEIPSKTYVRRIDLLHLESAVFALIQLIQEMETLDLMVLNAGVNIPNPGFDLDLEETAVGVNVAGFVAMANVAIQQFLKQGGGHLVGISSIAALRGSARSPSYNASKAFLSNYMAGLRQRFSEKNIDVSDIRPGYVDTDMIRHMKGVFWAASPEEAARQIFEAIQKKRKTVYVTKRWFFLAQLFRMVPDWLYNWGYGRFYREKGREAQR